MRWLALDIGSRRVGAAICDDGETVVSALAPLPFTDPARLARAVGELAAERGVGGIVIGVPRTRDGASRGERRVAAVVAAVRAAVAVEVAEIDEGGTTREAGERLREAGVGPRRWKDLIDGVAAQVMLEEHLAQRRRRGESVDRAMSE